MVGVCNKTSFPSSIFNALLFVYENERLAYIYIGGQRTSDAILNGSEKRAKRKIFGKHLEEFLCSLCTVLSVVQLEREI